VRPVLPVAAMVAAIVVAQAAAAPTPVPGPGGGGTVIPPAPANLPTADAPTWGPPGAASPFVADAASADPVARGRYLAVAGDCETCHTAAGGAPWAGSRPIFTPFGAIYTANITPDVATGIGAWSADDFYKAMHNGVRHGGGKLYPAFPYPYFTHIERADSDALYAYLKTVPAAAQVKPANKLPFPLNIRPLMGIWNALFFKPATFAPDPARSAQWNRGAYLVTGPGHCGACHTPKNFLAADKTSRALQGGKIDNWTAVNLTGDGRDGLGAWSEAEIARFLRTGRNARASASGSMTEVIWASTSRMSDADLAAMATYLKSVTASGRAAAATVTPAATLRMGQAIYLDSCSGCHRSGGEGVAGMFPPLKGDAVAQSAETTTLLRVIVTGARAIPTPGAPTPLAMPAYGSNLSDVQVAAVATYIRSSWGNAAAPISVGQVAKVRRANAR
jgi:mono/diheme cytochrome c family protein